ncbi:hypothetical protein FQZ97_897850 [compost metagenome]
MAGQGHGKMDMRGARRVGHRTNGSEAVAAIAGRLEAAIALEIGVAPGPVAATAVQVDAIGIDLPDFHQGVLQRVAAGIENLPVQLHHNAAGLGRLLADQQQVVVPIQRQLIGIEGTERLRRGQQQLGEEPRAGQQQAAATESGQQPATADACRGHVCLRRLDAHGYRLAAIPRPGGSACG